MKTLGKGYVGDKESWKWYEIDWNGKDGWYKGSTQYLSLSAAGLVLSAIDQYCH